ncbi:MAG TPA: hypothetical protein VKD08_06100 [Ignavibacteriaceae bacterium]|nr:hypothetical protein [Ignavibacteriaceae bacterium]
MTISVRFAILFILLSSIQIFSQNYLPLFSGYVPEPIMKDEDFKNQVNINIGHYASVNPDLVYYYIMYIDKRFGEKITNPDSNYYNLLRSEDYKFRKARNKWIQEEMKKAEGINPGVLFSAVRSNLSALYQEEINKYTDSVSLPVDEGKLQYFTYMIASGKKSQYNDNFNYLSGSLKLMDKKSEEFRTIYSDASSMDQPERYQAIESALNFPYLFNGSYLQKYKQDSDLSLFEFLRKMHVDDYIQKNAVKAGIFYFKNNFKYENEILFKEKPFPYFHLENKDKGTITSGIIADIGFRLGLRNNKTPFSYVEIDAGYEILSDFSTDDDINSFQIQRDSFQPSTGKHSIITYTLKENNKSSHYEIYGRIATPVYYFSNKIYIEAGLNYFYTAAERNYYDITRHIDTLVSNDPADFEEYTQNISTKISKGNFYPSVGFNYSLYEFLNFKVEYLVPVLLTAKAELFYYF